MEPQASQRFWSRPEPSLAEAQMIEPAPQNELAEVSKDLSQVAAIAP